MEKRLNIQDRNKEGASMREVVDKIKLIFREVLRRWVIVAVAAVIGLVFGVTYASTQSNQYIAATTFVLEESDKGGGLGQYAGIASMVGVDLGGGGGGVFQGDNILQLYKSRTMIEKTLLTEVSDKAGKKLLVDVYLDFNHSKEQWKKNPELLAFKITLDRSNAKVNFRLQDSVLGKIVEDINKNYLYVSKPDKKLSVIEVKVKAPNEFFAKEFNMQIVKNVNDFYIQTKTKKSANSIAIMQQKTDSVRNVMNGAIYSSAVVSDATPNLNITRQVQRTAPMQRSQFTVETNKAMLSELIKNLELSKITLSKETPLIQVIDLPVYPLPLLHFSKIKFGLIGCIAAIFLVSLYLAARAFFKMALAESL